MLQNVGDEHRNRRAVLALYRSYAPLVPPRRLNAFRKAVQWLYPWTDATYPGFRRGASQVTGASVGMIRHWLAGRKRLPQAVRTRLIEAIRSRLEQGQAVLAELEAMETPEKRSPVQNIQRARAARNEAAKSHLDNP